MRLRILPDKLQTLRLQRALSIAELAEKSGLTYNTISSLEKGKQTRTQYKTVRSLAIALNVEIGELTELV